VTLGPEERLLRRARSPEDAAALQRFDGVIGVLAGSLAGVFRLDGGSGSNEPEPGPEAWPRQAIELRDQVARLADEVARLASQPATPDEPA